MEIIADLQIHSKYARATSKNISIENLERYSRIKGLKLLGVGDFQHPLRRKEIDEKLTEDEYGILRTANGFPFLWQTEISLMYSQDGKRRAVHHLIFAPNREIADQITEFLGSRGRLDYDGRPIFGMSSPELVEALKKIDDKIEIIPAHIWTPWFGLFGSKSGFDSVEECFEDMSRHIYAIETGLSCYDEETEVLTEKGWKKISSVSYSDKIFTINPNSYKIELQKPVKIFDYKYEGKMYRLKTKRIDLLVTPNHNLFYTPCDFRNPKLYRLKEAQSLFGKSKCFKKDGIWLGQNPKNLMLPRVKIRHGSRFYSGHRTKKEKKFPIKEWLKFFGFWIAEGWTTKEENGCYGVYIANKNKNLLEEMKKILEGFGYNVYRGKDVIRVRDFQLFSYLKQFGKCDKKFIPSEVKTLSKELLEIFLNYYIKGDGHIYGRNGKGLSATTSSLRLRDDLQEIALKIGVSAYYKLGRKKGSPFNSPSQKKVYYQRNDTWVVYFIRQNKHAILPSYLKKFNYVEKWIDFKGHVYCVSVPNRVIYVRRKGIPVWCGNSDPAMNWRLSKLDKYTIISNSDAHSHWPHRIGREATVFEIPELSYDNIIKAIRTKKGLKETIEVSPFFGKYHLTGHRECNVYFEPKEAEKLNNICPKCKRELTVGVAARIDELADRPQGFVPKNAVPFKTLLPLQELLASLLGSSVASKRVWSEYYKLVNAFGSEFKVLLDTTKEELKKIVDERVANIILYNRGGKVKVKGGYDGVYGIPLIEKIDSNKKEDKKIGQKGLSDFM